MPWKMSLALLLLTVGFSLITVAFAILMGAKPDNEAPQVTVTNPRNNDRRVPSDLTAITITFSEPMMTDRFSFCIDPAVKFPEANGPATFSFDGKTVTYPVKLEPGRDYAIWLNNAQFQMFQYRSGNVLKPFLLQFQTAPLEQL
ncbi:Ig-like domain-containing protein [Bremerella sp. JC817]|uniref:Ig-like domain-containing protein n=1 Tax=Bremerella sp. JC817 TaxID=3231756 RepID=UPI003457DEF7